MDVEVDEGGAVQSTREHEREARWRDHGAGGASMKTIGQREHGDDGRRERSQDSDGTSAGSEDEVTLGEARGCGGGERDECGVVNETVVEATIQTRLQSVNGESVAAMEETKKAVEVETNAHSTRGICEHTG